MMKIKTILKALSIKAGQRLLLNKGLAKSYVSLFLVLVLGVTSSMAWFTAREAAELNSENLEFQSASSLRINKDKYSANKIEIPAFTLDEASSLDGRNIYFPVDKSFTSNTAEMFFREGNRGDENVHDVYKDFELKGTSGNTPVYIKSYKIQVGSNIYEDQLKVVDSNGDTISEGKIPDHQVLPKDHCPVRLAFIADSGVKPVVIDPSAQVVDYVDNSSGCVSLVDEGGTPTLEASYPGYNWNSFSTYYYEHTPLFIIPGGQKLNVTLVVWLEGSLEDLDEYKDQQISVDIDIESNFAEMDTITFVDDTIGDDDSNVFNWIDNKDNDKEPIIACSYEDPYSDENPKRWKTVIMRKTKNRTGTSSTDAGSEWQCEIPKKAVTNIAFYRLNPHNGSTQGTIYNPWYTRSNAQSLVQAAISDSTSNITSSWLTQGELQSTRTFLDTSTNTYDNALVYTAIHGNGYSSTNVSSKRLSPCVGYWNYDPGSGSSSSGGGQSSGGGGDSSVSNCNLTVIARLPDGKSWVSATDTLGFETDAGNSYYFTNNWTDSGKANQLTASIPVGEKIVRFCKKNSAGTNYYPFSAGTQTFTVPNSNDWTVTYTMTSGDYWGHN